MGKSAGSLRARQITSSSSGQRSRVTPKAYHFDGSTMYAVLGTPWEPLGQSYSMEITGETDDVVNAASAIGSENTRGISVLFGGAGYSYLDVDGLVDNSTVAGLDPDKVYTFKAEGDSSGTKLVVQNVVTGATAAVAKTVGQDDVVRIGNSSAGTSYWGGPLWGLRLTDDSPLQNRTVMVGNNARYVQLNNAINLPFADGFEIEFDYLRQDFNGTASARVVGEDTLDDYIQLNDSGNVNPNAIIFRSDSISRLFADALEDIAQGQHCNIRLAFDGGSALTCFVDGVAKGGTLGAPSGTEVNFNRLYRGDSATNMVNSGAAIGNVRFENLTTGDTWFYALENET